MKGYYWWKHNFFRLCVQNPASGDPSILAINRKSDSNIAIFRYDAIINFFDVVLFLLSILVTGPTFMSMSLPVLEFIYKGLTRNPEVGNSPVWVLPGIWRQGPVKDAKFDTNVSNKMLLNAPKCQGYSFYRFRVNKRKSTVGGGSKINLPPTQIK